MYEEGRNECSKGRGMQQADEEHDKRERQQGTRELDELGGGADRVDTVD